MLVRDWSKYPNFSKAEFDCKHTGENQMQEEFMEKLQELRTRFGKPIRISSGFRSLRHPVEAAKPAAALKAHNTGLAADVAVERQDAHRVLALALELGFTGIGVQQKGSGRFLHIDLVSPSTGLRPTVWSY